MGFGARGQVESVSTLRPWFVASSQEFLSLAQTEHQGVPCVSSAETQASIGLCSWPPNLAFVEPMRAWGGVWTCTRPHLPFQPFPLFTLSTPQGPDALLGSL